MDYHPLLTLFGVLALTCVLCGAQGDTCTEYTNCDTFPCQAPDYNLDMLVWLEQTGPGFGEFQSSMQKAVDIMQTYPGVVSQDMKILHMTLQCMYYVFIRCV